MYLVGFTMEIYYDARPCERRKCTNILRASDYVTWCKQNIVYHSCTYNRLPEDEPSDSKHEEDIKNYNIKLRQHVTPPLSAKVGTSFADRRRPLCRPRPCRAVAPLDFKLRKVPFFFWLHCIAIRNVKIFLDVRHFMQNIFEYKALN